MSKKKTLAAAVASALLVSGIVAPTAGAATTTFVNGQCRITHSDSEMDLWKELVEISEQYPATFPDSYEAVEKTFTISRQDAEKRLEWANGMATLGNSRLAQIAGLYGNDSAEAEAYRKLVDRRKRYENSMRASYEKCKAGPQAKQDANTLSNADGSLNALGIVVIIVAVIVFGGGWLAAQWQTIKDQLKL